MSKLAKGSRWRHRKTGTLYVVQDTAVLESDESVILVLYRREDSDLAPLWARPRPEFTDGRFEPLEGADP